MRCGKVLLLLVLCVFVISCASSQAKTEQKQAQDFQDLYERALVAMRYNLFDEAIKYLNNALSLSPHHYHSYFLLAVAYAQKGNYKEAAAAFEKSLELKPGNPEARLKLADVYRQLNLMDKAEEQYKKALAIDNNTIASFNLAVLYYERGELDQALEYVEKSIQQGNLSAEAFNLQGVLLNQMKQYSDAIISFQNVLRIDPNHTVAAINMAVAYFNINNLNKAREILLKIRPNVQEQELKDRIDELLEKIKEYR
ncbi:MAG: tetratricopeptide repeat protein [Candidatus Aminicenantes bacterium]|jgi:tetratricopeptide (TPR) repeat protein